MVTASHNPKDDNGFKFSYNGIHNAYGDSSKELYEMIINNDFIESDVIGSVKKLVRKPAKPKNNSTRPSYSSYSSSSESHDSGESRW